MAAGDTIRALFRTAFRRFTTDGVQSSGDHEPDKHEVIAAGDALGSALNGLEVGQVQGHPVFTSKAALDAALNYDANTKAEVHGDPTPANNGIYQKQGASGAGSWTKIGDYAITDLGDRVTDIEPYIPSIPLHCSVLSEGMTTNGWTILLEAAVPLETRVHGRQFTFRPTQTNPVGTVLINIDGTGVVGLRNQNGEVPNNGQLRPGRDIVIRDDTSRYLIMAQPGEEIARDLQAPYRLFVDNSASTPDDVVVDTLTSMYAVPQYALFTVTWPADNVSVDPTLTINLESGVAGPYVIYYPDPSGTLSIPAGGLRTNQTLMLSYVPGSPEPWFLLLWASPIQADIVTLKLLAESEEAATAEARRARRKAVADIAQGKTVAGLPPAAQYRYRTMIATDGRKTGETAGNGTGVMVWSDGVDWLTTHGNVAVED